jgi:cell division protein FtsB
VTGARQKRKWTPWRIAAVAIVAAAALFAVQGGEYSTLDIFRQRSRKARLVAQIDTLQRQVDSLQKYLEAVRTDPATQERIAREEFGMVKGDKELLYRFAEPSDSAAKP